MMKGCAVADQSEQGYWRRDERVFVYLSQQRARYASITRAPSGRQMILFTHQTEDQEKAGKGDLWLVRRTTDGNWWFYPETIYEGEVGEPRTYGSMTTLESGKIIAPFAELNHEPTPARSGSFPPKTKDKVGRQARSLIRNHWCGRLPTAALSSIKAS